MNDKLPYEESLEHQLNDLPLPDEEQSWQKMKALLEDDDDDRIIPPIFLKGCMGWGLLLFVVLLAVWLIVGPEKWWKKDIGKTETSKENTKLKNPDIIKSTGTKNDSIFKSIPVERNSSIVKTDEPDDVKEKKSKILLPNTSVSQQITVNQKNSINSPIRLRKTSNQTAKAKSQKTSTQKDINPQPNRDKTPFQVGIAGTKPIINNDEPVQEKNQIPAISLRQIDSAIKRDSVIKKDSVIKDSIVSPVVQEKHKKTKQTKRFYASAGLGLQQQIPLAGQSATPYNYYGRKGSLADYIPSIYLRLHREDKWFIQGEFRYGAPQAVKELAYDQVTIPDSFATSTITRTLTLKKTFYHQVPLSFNYQVIPNLTIGAGGIYSRFYRAVIEDEFVRRTNQTVTFQTKEIKTVYKNDSSQNFTNSQIQLLFQASYQLKKFSFTLAYTRGLQPFIRYTDTNGALMEEKNHSLQFAVKFKLWESKRF